MGEAWLGRDCERSDGAGASQGILKPIKYTRYQVYGIENPRHDDIPGKLLPWYEIM